LPPFIGAHCPAQVSLDETTSTLLQAIASPPVLILLYAKRSSVSLCARPRESPSLCLSCFTFRAVYCRNSCSACRVQLYHFNGREKRGTVPIADLSGRLPQKLAVFVQVLGPEGTAGTSRIYGF
jgi:hypothetical protein